MLLALGLLALIALWWIGRSGARLPRTPLPGVSLRQIAACALFGLALLAALRGGLLPGLLLAGGGLWLLWGGAGLARRLGGLFARRDAALRRSATVEIAGEADVLDGTVLAGPQAGRRLSAVPLPDLLALWALCRSADPEGARLLETYLDRRHAGWRVDAQRDPDPRTGGPLHPGAMTEEEAYQILGLERGASAERIRTVHRALMKRLHPDQGGSAERAARVNAARDRLLNRHR